MPVVHHSGGGFQLPQQGGEDLVRGPVGPARTLAPPQVKEGVAESVGHNPQQGCLGAPDPFS
jgi:hypothetical protein